MTTRFFRRAILCLLAAVILMLGGVGFVIWNGQADHGRQVARDGSGRSEMAGAEEQGDDKIDSGSAEKAQPPRTGSPGPGKREKEDKGDSRSGEGTQTPRAGGAGSARRGEQDSRQAEGAKTYQVDTDASRVYVKVGSATRIGHPHGVEGKLKSGKISPGAGGELVFDLRSFTADTREARRKVGLAGKRLSENEAKKVNQTMRGADVLDVEKFPTATYRIIVIKPAERQEAGAPGVYEVNGRFALHGAEQPLRFKARLERTDKEGVLKLSGSFAIKQTDYGMQPYSAAGGLAKVADELEITGELLLGPEK
jgi:polyisoprenoid-binding protein YceI